jgi:O-antigen/teichoic acid export membrane protein
MPQVEAPVRAGSELVPLPVGFSVHRIFSSILSNWFGLGANVLVAFLITPFVIRHLGNTSYGIWALILQCTGYMGVIDVGVRSALVRFVARFHAEGKLEDVNEFLSTALLVYGGLSLLLIVWGAVLAAFVIPHMNIPAPMLASARAVLLLSVCTGAVAVPLGAFQAVLAALFRWPLLNGVAIGTLLARTALIVLVLWKGHGLVALALIHCISTAVGAFIHLFLSRRCLPGLVFSTKLARRKMVGPLFRHGLYSALISAGNRLNYEVDNIVIAAFLPVGLIAFYVIGSRLVQYWRDLVNGAVQIVMPLVSGLEARGSAEDLGLLFLRTTKYLLLLGSPLALGLLLLGPDFIRLWMGPDYAARSGLVLVILGAAQFVSLTECSASAVLCGLSKHKANVWCTGLEGILNLGLSVALVRPYGIYGVALGTTLAVVVVRGFVYPPIYFRLLQVSAASFFRKAVWPSVAPTLVFGIGVWCCKRWIPVTHYIGMLAAAMPPLMCCLLWTWFFCLENTERQRLRHLALHHLGRCPRSVELHG